MTQQLVRLLTYFLAAISTSLFSASASAQSFLSPEQAFYIDAHVSDGNRVIVNFDIASGYYMYQERFEFALENAPIVINGITYPPAKVKYDPTFEKEMGLYFKTVNVEVELASWPQNIPTTTFVLKVVSQGCAEKGICYPPVTSALLIESLDYSQGYRVLSITANLDDETPPRAPSVKASSTESTPSRNSKAVKNGNFAIAEVDSNATNTANNTSDTSLSNLINSSDDSQFARALSGSSFWGNVALFFLLGVLLSFTPCVLPMIPILSVLIVGQGNVVTRARGLGLAAAYVAGMSIIYTALGVVAGLSGAGLAAWLQTPWVLGIFAALLALMGLAMFDVVRIEMPQAIQTKLSTQASSMRGGKLLVAFVMGAISALIVGPCVAAPLAGALLYISQTKDVWLGGGALFAMAWGMGLPLLVVGASAGSLIPKAGAWMEGVKAFFGVLLLATAWWMLSPVISEQINLIGWSVLAIFSGILLGTFEPRDQSKSMLLQGIKKTIGLMLILLALIWLIGALTGGRSLVNPLGHITQSNQINIGVSNNQLVEMAQGTNSALNKPTFQLIDSVEALETVLVKSTTPVMLDFYADWCVSCKEMEAFTFSSPLVIQRMQRMQLIKADVTKNTPQHRALLKKFNLFGPPGIIFFEPGGKEIKDVRVVGFQNAEKFTENLDRVLTE